MMFFQVFISKTAKYIISFGDNIKSLRWKALITRPRPHVRPPGLSLGCLLLCFNAHLPTALNCQSLKLPKVGFKHGVSLHYMYLLLNLYYSYVLFLYLIIIEKTHIY